MPTVFTLEVKSVIRRKSPQVFEHIPKLPLISLSSFPSFVRCVLLTTLSAVILPPLSDRSPPLITRPTVTLSLPLLLSLSLSTYSCELMQLEICMNLPMSIFYSQIFNIILFCAVLCFGFVWKNVFMDRVVTGLDASKLLIHSRPAIW